MMPREQSGSKSLHRLSGKILLSDYAAKWPALFRREALRIQAALGRNALRVEDIGSTSVPDLEAKPVIDVIVVVPASADEHTYVPPLEPAGYLLTILEPHWRQHRMFNRRDASVNA